MSTSYFRGWKAWYSWEKEDWLYCDTNESTDNERPCKRCGKHPTEEGYDGCLGYIPGAYGACCSHGIREPYVIVGLGQALEGKEFWEWMNKKG